MIAVNSRKAEIAEKDAVAFFESFHNAFQEAKLATGIFFDQCYRIADYTICLHFVGHALSPLITPAIEQKTIPPEKPDLNIFLWDSASTKVPAPRPPWSIDDYMARGEVRGYNNDRIKVTYRLDVGTLCMLDIEQNVAIYWSHDPVQIPYYETGAPLLDILHWWMREHGRQLLHGAVVSYGDCGALIAGKGGSGKSTTALACLDSKLNYISDDYCLVSTETEPFAYNLYSSAKLDATTIEKFPNLFPAIHNANRLDREKALLFLNRLVPDRIGEGCFVRAVLLPQISGKTETRIERISPGASLVMLAPSTLFQLSGAGSLDFSNLSRIVRNVPSYSLKLGTDLSQIPGAIARLLSEC
jgi:hypothetical protein